VDDRAAFDQDFRGRIERARNVNQLIAIWSWAQQFKSLPAFSLTFLASRLADENEWAVAKDVIRRALEVRPADFELHRYHGWYLRNLGKAHYADAEKAFREALRFNPSDPETIGMLAGLLKRQGRFSAAAELYEQGALLASTNRYMKVNRAGMELLANVQSPHGAQALYRALIQEVLGSEPSESDTWSDVLCAEAYFVLGDDEASRRHFEAAARRTSSATVLRSPADQIELFGMHGFRPEAASKLSSRVRSLIKEPSTSSPVQANHLIAKTPLTSNPVIIHLTDVHFGSKLGPDGKPVRMHRFLDGDDSQSLEDHLLHEFKSTRRHFS